jgi:hypothetical protein
MHITGKEKMLAAKSVQEVPAAGAVDSDCDECTVAGNRGLFSAPLDSITATDPVVYSPSLTQATL